MNVSCTICGNSCFCPGNDTIIFQTATEKCIGITKTATKKCIGGTETATKKCKIVSQRAILRFSMNRWMVCYVNKGKGEIAVR